jgi:TonB-dependent siderophore receptor
MVRKKPQQEFSADISASVGSYDTYRAEGNITGALTEDKNLLGHLTFAYTDEGSFTDGINTKGVVVAPSIEARINDNTRVLLQLLYQEEAFDQNPGIPAKIEGDRIVPYDVSRSFLFGALGDEKSKTELLDANLKIDHQFSDDWLASLLLQKSQQTRDLIHANAGYAYYTPDPVVDIDHSNTEEEIDRWAGELRLEGNFSAFGQEQQVLLGLEQNQQDKVRGWGNYTQYGVVNIYTDNFADAGIFSRADVPITDIDTSKVANKAVYAQTMLTLHERTKLLVSARYDRAEQTSSGFDETVENEEVTYRIGLTQTFTENINAYANYGQSFNPVLKKGENNSILEPETGEAYELGLKTYWFDSKFGANLAIYRQELTNRPVTDPDSIGPGKDGYSMSAGLHRTDGVELELTGSPYPGLTVAAAATWMDNEFLDSKDSFYGLSLHGSVDNRFSLYANYELQSGALKGFGLGTTLQSVNDRNHDSWFDGEKSTDDYKLLDIHLSYNALRNWNISLLIHNIFDEKYLKSLDTPYQANYFGAPRSVLLKATYHFD